MFLRPANDISCKHDIACWAFATKKRTAHMNDSQEAQTRFELVIRVLQTRALPLGYCALYLEPLYYIKGSYYRQEIKFLTEVTPTGIEPVLPP